MKIYRGFLFVVFVLALSGLLAGCFLRPAVGYAGYAIINNPDSRSTLVIGSNNTQANAVHSPLGASGESQACGCGKENCPACTQEEGKPACGCGGCQAGSGRAVADGKENRAYAGGLFVNNTVGNRSADIDATSSLEKLSRVRESTVGQNTGRDQSPVNAETTPTYTTDRRTSITVPLSASQNGNASSSASPAWTEGEGDGAGSSAPADGESR